MSIPLTLGRIGRHSHFTLYNSSPEVTQTGPPRLLRRRRTKREILDGGRTGRGRSDNLLPVTRVGPGTVGSGPTSYPDRWREETTPEVEVRPVPEEEGWAGGVPRSPGVHRGQVRGRRRRRGNGRGRRVRDRQDLTFPRPTGLDDFPSPPPTPRDSSLSPGTDGGSRVSLGWDQRDFLVRNQSSRS